MHFHAEHTLFFEQRKSPRVVALCISLTVCVLVVNAGARSLTISLIGAGLGGGLLLLARAHGYRRVESALAWSLVLAVLAMLSRMALDLNPESVLETTSRVLCGVIWTLWLGTQIDWASFRQLLLRLRMPEGVVGHLDHTFIHGVLTQREWVQRRDAARLRLGSSHLPISSWGQLLSEGALQALVRLEEVSKNMMLRGVSSEAIETHEGVYLEAVSVERGGQFVLEQLELKLERAECLLVCGPSGAGKSSLLRLLAGLDGPSKGHMMRFGDHVSPTTMLRDRLNERVALLCQNPEHHFIASTVAEDIVWGLLRRGVEPSRAKRRTYEVAVALRIDHLLERPCHQLSFGEQRRVALAGLLVLNPDLLLLDEPTAGLDPVAAHELGVLVAKYVRKANAACIWATHDLYSLPPGVSRVALLRDRRLLFDGPTSEGLSKSWLVRAGLAVSSGE